MLPPRISIVLPNYNSAGTLERTILSLERQSYPNLQLIFMDSKSTDDSLKIVEKYRSLFDKIIVEKDDGQADGINRGFEHADGEILGWLCCDDELAGGCLEHVAKLFAENPNVDVITGACDLRFPDGSSRLRQPEADPWAKVCVQCCLEQPATFWRASLHRKLGKLDTGFHLCFDWDFWNRMRRAGAKIKTTDKTLAVYHFSETNKTGSAGRRFVVEASIILSRYGPRMGLIGPIFRFLYKTFDLHGCYDKPPTCTLVRSHMFIWSLAALRLLIGKRLLYLYNWHFAACQERGMKWWV